MGFLNIFDKFTKKELPQENYLSLTITPDRILAQIWTFENDDLKFLGFGKKTFQNIDGITHQAAVAIDVAGQKAKGDIDKTVFGLSQNWFEQESLSDQTLKLLKDLSSDLELDSEAYVSLASAASHFLKLEESADPNVILVGLFKLDSQSAFCEIHLCKNNKIIKTSKYDGMINPEKVKQQIKRLNPEDKDLPPRIVLFGSNEDFALKMKKLDWQDLFIHEPKIDFLDDDKLAKAVAFTQARDILGYEPVSQDIPTVRPEKKEKKSDSFGFIEGEDILLEKSQEEVPNELAKIDKKSDEHEETKDNESTADKEEKDNYAVDLEDQKNVIAPQIVEETEEPSKKSTKIGFALKFPSLLKPSKKLGIALAVVIILAISGSFVAAQQFSQAEVLIKVNAKSEERDFKVNVVVKNPSQDQILGQEITGQAAGSQKGIAGGTKTIGEYAQGEITILNWTKESKNFPEGIAVITKNGLKFSLSSGIEVASRSASTPGQNNVNVKAQEFGISGNITSGNDFTFQQYDELLYSAKNDQAFTGGNEKQVTVVTQEDLAKLEKSLTDSLLEKARNNLKEKISGQKFHDSSEVVKITKKEFDKNLDEEASLINLDMSIDVSAIVYNEDDLRKQLASAVNKDLSGDQEVRFEDLSISEIKATRNNNVLILNGKYQSRLIPKFNEQDLKDKISGKTTKDARAAIKSLQEVSDVQVNFSPNLPFIDTLPHDKSKIKFKVETN